MTTTALIPKVCQRPGCNGLVIVEHDHNYLMDIGTCLACGAEYYGEREGPTERAPEKVANGQKTHCPYGHVYDEQNTFVFETPSGGQGRGCKTCRRQRQRKIYWRGRG